MLAATIWGHGDARHTLRQTLLAVRRQLGDAALSADPHSVALGPGLETDLAQFERHLAAGSLDAGCGLVRGHFCEGLDGLAEAFDDWLAAERAVVDQKVAGALADLAAAAEAADRPDRALAAARLLVSLDPFDEAAQARLNACYRRRGWSSAARLAHRRCFGLFARELDLSPGPEVQSAARTPLGEPASAAKSAPRTRWRPLAAAGLALVLFSGVALLEFRIGAEPAVAAPHSAWVAAEDWRPDAEAESGGVALPEAIDRALAGDPAFAHLRPAGC